MSLVVMLFVHRKLSAPDDMDTERILRERRPNPSNVAELLTMMQDTRSARRQWIEGRSPSITEILQRYPRLQDVPEAVCLSTICHL